MTCFSHRHHSHPPHLSTRSLDHCLCKFAPKIFTFYAGVTAKDGVTSGGPIPTPLPLVTPLWYSQRLLRTSTLTTGTALSEKIIRPLLRDNWKVKTGARCKLSLFSHMTLHTGFRLVSKSVTLNDLEKRNDLRCPRSVSLRQLSFLLFVDRC